MTNESAYSQYATIKQRIGLKTSRAVDAACYYLERRGQRFCVDFGTENALEKAFDILEREWLADREVRL